MLYVIVVFLIIGLIDLWELIKENKRREFKVTLTIMIIAFILSSLYVLNYKIPSHLVALDKFFKDVLGLSY